MSVALVSALARRALRRLEVATLVAGALASSCSQPDAPRWTPLADGQRSGAPLVDAAHHLRIEPGGEVAWLDFRIAPLEWSAGKGADTWVTARPDGLSFMKGSGEELHLRRPTGEFRCMDQLDNLEDLARLEPGAFAAVGDRLHLRLGAGERPTEELLFSVRKPRARAARPTLGGWTGAGFTLWSGESMAFAVQVQEECRLGFYWAVEGIPTPEHPTSRAHLRVLRDQEVVLEKELEADLGGLGEWQEVRLARAGPATLRFELGGEACLGAVLAPVLGPVAPLLDPPPAAGPERSRASGHPDLILFLADTFRADNLAYAGGAADLAPNLNRLAEESVCFSAARSPSTWTLPSQASMLTGLYPEQHGATSMGRSLALDVTTLPEFLAQHGYRTGAVTDSAFVSRNYGFDQGFEWFQEDRTWDLGATLRAARAFLEADDGRPVFLFVHTFRAHMPYRTGADEDRSALNAAVKELRARGASVTPRQTGERLQQVYHQGVQALDQLFGAWWDELEGLPRRRDRFLVFTSDHGEAFYEHEDLGHGGTPWEEKIRIPLFLHGPGLAHRIVEHPASLVDLPATLCALAGLPAWSGGEGRDLIALDRSRPSYSFVHIGEQPMVAVIVEGRKIYGPADPARLGLGEVRGATDLARDPEERLDMATTETWPAELARAQAARVESLVRAVVTPGRVDLSEEDRRFLDDIGYGGD